MGEFTEQIRIQSRKKRKRQPKQTEYSLAPLEADGLLTAEFGKHMLGLHDQSTHGNRIGGHWGASHAGSSDITGMAAKLMKTEGFHVGAYGDSKQTKLSARTVLRGVRDSPGESDTHYSGHVMSVKKGNHKVGDKLEIPAMAVSGGRDTAGGYASRRDSDFERHYVLYRFPPGTKMKGYQKNPAELRFDESGDWDYKWDEAIVSGRFHVTKVHKEYEHHYSHKEQKDLKYPVTVYTLSQDEVFDPDTEEWVKASVSKEFNPAEPRDKDGKWSLLDAMKAMLAETEDAEEEHPYPTVDHHKPWESVSYDGKQVSEVHANANGATSLPSSVMGKHESDSLDDYVAFDRNTLRINTALRNGDSLKPEDEERNRGLDSVASRAKLSKDMDLWRGAVLSDEQYNALEPGAELQDHGYGSASPHREVAEYYAHDRTRDVTGKKVIFRIRGKKGNNIIPARGDEFVIPRSTKMTVTKKHDGVVEVVYR